MQILLNDVSICKHCQVRDLVHLVGCIIRTLCVHIICPGNTTCSTLWPLKVPAGSTLQSMVILLGLAVYLTLTLISSMHQELTFEPRSKQLNWLNNHFFGFEWALTHFYHFMAQNRSRTLRECECMGNLIFFGPVRIMHIGVDRHTYIHRGSDHRNLSQRTFHKVPTGHGQHI